MRTRVLLPVVSAGLALVLAGCGGSSNSSAAATTAGPAAATTVAAGGPTTTVNRAARGAALQSWRDCLSQHGVTLPSIPTGAGAGGGQNDPNAPDANGLPPVGDPGQITPDANAPQPPTGSTIAGQNDPNAGGRGGFGGLNTVLADPNNKAAVDACASLQPQFGPGGGGGFGGGAGGAGGAGGGQRGQAFQAYLSCMKDNGVSVPTTVAGATTIVGATTTAGAAGGPGGPLGGIDRNDPNYAAANAKCSALLPQRGQGGSTTTTTNG